MSGERSKCPGCGQRSYEISHCRGATPAGGGSMCHSSQCHMVGFCHSCERETYFGCAVPSHSHHSGYPEYTGRT